MNYQITSLPSQPTATKFTITGLPGAPAQAAPLNEHQQAVQAINAQPNPLGKVAMGVGEAARQTTEALTAPWSPLGWVTGAIGGAAKALGTGVEAVSNFVAPKIGQALRGAVGANTADLIGQKLREAAHSPLAQGIQKTYGSGDVPQALGAVQNVANLAGTVSGAAGVAEALNNPGIGKAFSGISDVAQQHYVANEAANWAKPSTVAKPSYNKPTEILTNAAGRGNDIPTTLVKNRITLANNIDNGTYATADTAAQLRTDASKLSSELLRPSLQMADYTTPKVPVTDIVKSTIDDITHSRGATPHDIQRQITRAKAEGAALAKKYPDGMSLTEMHDNKITYASHGKYSPIGDMNVNNIAAVNRSFGRTLGGLVEAKAPAGVPVKEFNAELAKQYQAADYLESLHGKKVPQSILSRVARTAAKVTGAAAGHAMGGGILGGVGGYHIGGMLETMLENMPNPVKGHFLNTLEMTNPQAFTAVKNFIGEEQAAQLQRRQLPAPSPLGSSKNPITPTPPTVYDKPAPKNNYQETPKSRINIGLGIKDVNMASIDALNAFMDSAYSALKKLEFPSTRPGDVIGAFNERNEIVKKIEDGTATVRDLQRGRELIRLYAGK